MSFSEKVVPEQNVNGDIELGNALEDPEAFDMDQGA